MASWFEAGLPVVSAFLGAGAVYGATRLTESRQDQRAREARQDEREKAAIARRDEFELPHLLETYKLLRAQEAALSPFIEAYDKGLSYNTEEARAWSQAMDAASTALTAQVGLILDDEVRKRVYEARVVLDSVCDDLKWGADGALSDEDYWQFPENAYEALTARVRDIYANR